MDGGTEWLSSTQLHAVRSYGQPLLDFLYFSPSKIYVLHIGPQKTNYRYGMEPPGATDIGTKMGCLKTKYVERRGCFGIDDRLSIELPSNFGKEKT